MVVLTVCKQNSHQQYRAGSSDDCEDICDREMMDIFFSSNAIIENSWRRNTISLPFCSHDCEPMN